MKLPMNKLNEILTGPFSKALVQQFRGVIITKYQQASDSSRY